MGRSNALLSALRDLVVLAAILAAVNFLLDGGDPGWMRLNPTPWLLPAALVGARYGFTSGFAGGLVVALILAGIKTRMQDGAIDELLREHAYFYLSIVVTGAVAGEIGRLLGLRNATIRDSNRQFEAENNRLRHQLHLTDETRHQLQQQLVLLNAPVCALDDELKTLFTYPQGEFGQQLLRILHRLTDLTSAGIYVADGDTLRQSAVLHPTPPLVPSLSLRDTPLAEKALSSGALVSVADATELQESQPFLAALPWLDHLGRSSVLLIQDMPLAAFNLRNLARQELILSWASAIAVLRLTFLDRAGRDHTVTNDDFLVLLTEALAADRIHGLPSAVLRCDFDSTESLHASIQRIPNTAVATRFASRNALAVLLPFSGEAEALQTKRAIVTMLPSTRIQHYLVTGDIMARDLWATLQEP